MKYTFADGRSQLYQWDKNVVLNVPGLSDGTEVHFGISAAQSVKETVAGGKVMIPNALLQHSKNIWMFAYKNGVTVGEGEIRVIGRPKPAGYAEQEA